MRCHHFFGSSISHMMAYSQITFTRKKLLSTQTVQFVVIRIMTHHCRVRDLVAAFEKPSIEPPHRKLPLWQGRGSQDPRHRFIDLSIMSRMQPRVDPMEYVQKCVEVTTTQDEFLKTSRPYGGVPPPCPYRVLIRVWCQGRVLM